MLKKIFAYQNSSTIGAAAILAVASLISRFFGLIRDRLLAAKFGASLELDIYYAAFRLPDLIFNILIVGAISAAFIPLFAEQIAKDKASAWRYTNNLFNFVLLSVVFIGIFLIVFTKPVVALIAPGFEAQALAKAVQLSKIMFLSPLFLGLSSIVSGVLQYFKRFLITAIAPIFYNIGIIVGIILFLPKFGLVGLAFGVVLGALLHLLIQWPLLKKLGFSWRPFIEIKDRNLWQTLTLMIPRTIASISSQINLWVITAIASLLAVGSIAIFNFSQNLSYLPIGIFGITLAVAIFPNLAQSEAIQDKNKFFQDFSQGFRLIFFFTFPLGLFFYSLRAHLVRVVLGAGAFSWVDTRLTAACLGIFALSIFAQSLIPYLSRAFFAIKDTRTPTILAVIFVAINVIFALLFVKIMSPQNFLATLLRIDDLEDIRVIALPLAFSLATIIQFCLMFWFLQRKIKFSMFELAASAEKVIFASLTAVAVTYLTLYGAVNFLETNTFTGIFIQGLISGLVGVSIYLFIMILARSSELALIYSVFRSKLRQKIPSDFQSENGKI
ncbi:murein biosynthesis integral membrane protein MurJ [Candidatus Parcubacteria bacterium]|nr:MAG: murein biosynthesis integral membrane protein MurJ [Candidatus Parcubacteria bacterium]